MDMDEQTPNDEMSVYELPYLVLPHEMTCALMDGGIRLLDIKVYAIIQAGGAVAPWCHASNAYFASECRTTIDKVSNAITKLKRAGFVVQEKFDGRTRHLRIVVL